MESYWIESECIKIYSTKLLSKTTDLLKSASRQYRCVPVNMAQTVDRSVPYPRLLFHYTARPRQELTQCNHYLWQHRTCITGILRQIYCNNVRGKYIHTCIHAYIHTLHTHTYIHTLHTHTYITWHNTYIKYIHYMHTYIYTYSKYKIHKYIHYVHLFIIKYIRTYIHNLMCCFFFANLEQTSHLM